MKKIGILGTGAVGNTVGAKLIKLGYEVKMGSRNGNHSKAEEWIKANGSKASQGTFAKVASYGDIVFNCVKGEYSLEAMKMAGAENLAGKVLIDLGNPLDFSKGMPPTLIPSLANTNSLGEAIQQLLPNTKVVKTLNIVNCEVMVDPSKCGGNATMFVAGNDNDAKKEATAILTQFGWNDIIDLGGIQNARGMEMMLPIWVSTYMATKNGFIGFKITR